MRSQQRPRLGADERVEIALRALLQIDEHRAAVAVGAELQNVSPPRRPGLELALRSDRVRAAAFHLVGDERAIYFARVVPLPGGKGTIERVEHSRGVRVRVGHEESEIERAADPAAPSPLCAKAISTDSVYAWPLLRPATRRLASSSSTI